MINRIRDIRRQKRLTLADVAARCDPPTTAQTIGRLETGMRNLSLVWMNRIAAALGVEPQALVRGDGDEATKLIARLTEIGPEPLAKPTDAVLPDALMRGEGLVAMAIDSGCGEYRAGDLVWLRRVEGDAIVRVYNRDALVPRPGGRFAFGRVIDHHRDGKLALLPPGAGKRQIVVDNPAWVATAEMLVRAL